MYFAQYMSKAIIAVKNLPCLREVFSCKDCILGDGLGRFLAAWTASYL